METTLKNRSHSIVTKGCHSQGRYELNLRFVGVGVVKRVVFGTMSSLRVFRLKGRGCSLIFIVVLNSDNYGILIT